MFWQYRLSGREGSNYERLARKLASKFEDIHLVDYGKDILNQSANVATDHRIELCSQCFCFAEIHRGYKFGILECRINVRQKKSAFTRDFPVLLCIKMAYEQVQLNLTGRNSLHL